MARFSIKTEVFFGKDGLNESLIRMRTLGIRNVGFIVDRSILNLDILLELQENFTKKSISVRYTEPFDASEEPSYDLIDDYVKKFRGRDVDAFIAIGGGSVLDAAKCVGILLRNPGRSIDYRGLDKVVFPGVPVICLPTTAGTGSEVTHTASLIDKKSKTKLGINGANVAPLFGILIPELTFSCPPKVTVFSGLDAMLHAIEAISAKTANAVTKMIGSQAFGVLFRNFKKVLQDPKNYESREAMMLGSYYAGIAMMNAGGGPASGISYPIGTHFGVPHGIAGGVFLQHVFDFNVSRGYTGYASAYDFLPEADLSLGDQEKSIDFVKKFRRLYRDIDAPQKLTQFGLEKEDIEFVADLTMEQRVGNLELNPVPFGRSEVTWILEKVI